MNRLIRNGIRPMAKARPAALPMPGARSVSAFTPPSVYERWNAECAGIRPSALAAGDNVITMFDVIGEDWWTGGGITAKKVASQLRAIGDRPVEVQINSNGGDMFEGIAIYNVLREHPQDITVKVMGMAASSASIIAMAGDRVEIGAASFLMIHNCWVFAMGNRHELRQAADWLEPFDQAMTELYVARSGQKSADVTGWLDAETYMSGSMAIERGFADELLPADQMRVDDEAKATDREANEVRALEIALVQSGMTRSQARARINKIKGKPDAAHDDDTPGAVALDPETLGAFANLLTTIRS